MNRRGFFGRLAGAAAVLLCPCLPAPSPSATMKDLWISPEALADMRAWTVVEVDEVTRKEIFAAWDGTIKRECHVNVPGW